MCYIRLPSGIIKLVEIMNIKLCLFYDNDITFCDVIMGNRLLAHKFLFTRKVTVA